MNNDNWETDDIGPGAQYMRETANATKLLGNGLKEAEKHGGVFSSMLKTLSRELAIAAGASLGFSLAGARVRDTLDAVARGFQQVAQKNTLERQFKALLGGAAAARQRVAELSQLLKSGFSLQSLGQANAQLEVLTKGALAGENAFRAFVDTAAGADVDIEKLSATVGTLYSRLQSGEPVADVSSELQAMGIVSAAARQQIDTLAASGAGFSAAFSVAESEMRKFRGGSEEAANSLANLEKRLQSAQDTKDAGVAVQFVSGAKAGAEAQVKLIEATAESAAQAARPIAGLYNLIQQLRLGFVDAVTSSDGFKRALSGISTAIASALLPVMVISVSGSIKLVAQLTALAVRSGIAARAIVGLGAALRLASAAVTVGNVAFYAIVTALSFIVTRYFEAAERARQFNESLDDQRKSARDSANAIMQQAGAIQNLRDKAQAQIATLEKLHAAEEKYARALAERKAAEKSGDATKISESSQIETRSLLEVKQMREVYEDIANIKAASLAPDREALDIAIERYRIEKQIRQDASDAIDARKSVDRQPAVIRGQLAGVEKQISSAETFHRTLREDQAAFDPLQRALDLAKQGGNSNQISAAQAAVEKFRADPSRNPNFTLSREIADREEARAAIDRTRAQIIQSRPRTSPELQEKLQGQMADAKARFGSLDAISPGSVAQLDQQRKRNEIDNDVNGLVSRRGDLNARLPAAEISAKEAKEESDLAQQRNAAEAQILALKEKGYELAVAEAAARKQAISAEISQLEKRIGNPRYNDSDTKNSITSLRNEGAGIDKGLSLQREEGQRTAKFANVELQAQKLEAGGNDEAAARKREGIKMEERILELRRAGVKEEEAKSIAKKETRAERLKRLWDANASAGGDPTVAGDFLPGGAGERFKRSQGRAALQAIQSVEVDSMTGIGGNAGAGDGSQSILRQILDEMRKANRTTTPSLPNVQWDDNRPRQERSF